MIGLFLGTYINISGDMVEEMLGYVGTFFDDFSPLLLILFGVSLLSLFIAVIIGAIKN